MTFEATTELQIDESARTHAATCACTDCVFWRRRFKGFEEETKDNMERFSFDMSNVDGDDEDGYLDIIDSTATYDGVTDTCRLSSFYQRLLDEVED